MDHPSACFTGLMAFLSRKLFLARKKNRSFFNGQILEEAKMAGLGLNHHVRCGTDGFYFIKQQTPSTCKTDANINQKHPVVSSWSKILFQG